MPFKRIKSASFLGLLLLPRLAWGDSLTRGWTWGMGCGSSGSSSTSYLFTATNSGGFSATGQCQRTTTRFTKFSFNTFTGGTLNSTTSYGPHTGDVLIIPPTLSTETQPIFTVASSCPWASKTLNWIYVQWTSATVLSNTYVLGEAAYSTSAGITVTQQYDVTGALYWSGNVAMPGSCSASTGIYTSTGAGDLGGDVYFTRLGAGVFKTGPGKATFFFPQTSVTLAMDLSSWSVQGITFDSHLATNTKSVRVTSNAAGTVFTVQPIWIPRRGPSIAAIQIRSLSLRPTTPDLECLWEPSPALA